MKTLKFWLMIVSFWSTFSLAQDNDIVVIVNINNPTQQMSHSEIIDLYMGKYVAFPNGKKAKVIDLKDSDAVKTKFYQDLVNMSLARVNAYWSRIKFTGRARPPEVYEGEKAVVDYVSQTTDAIAYVSRDKLTNDVKVVYEFD